MSTFTAWPVIATAKEHKSLNCGMGGRKGMTKPLMMMTKFLIIIKLLIVHVYFGLHHLHYSLMTSFVALHAIWIYTVEILY